MTLSHYLTLAEKLVGKDTVREWMKEAIDESIECAGRGLEANSLFFEKYIARKYRTEVEAREKQGILFDESRT